MHEIAQKYTHLYQIISTTIYRFGTSKSFSYNFVFGDKYTTIRKTVRKTVITFEYFLEFEHLFMHEIAPKYTNLYQIISTTI